MRVLRQVHLYLGCLFAPLLIYFAISGAWQLFRLNDLPRDAVATQAQTIFHALSAPHTHSTFPGNNPKSDQSSAFNIFALMTAIGLVVTTSLGIVLALQFGKNRIWVCMTLLAGFALPILLLLLHAR